MMVLQHKSLAVLEVWRIVMATLFSQHGRTGFGGVGHVESTHVLVYSLQSLLSCAQHSKHIQACEKSRFLTGQSCFLLVRLDRIKTCDPMMGVYQQGRSVDLLKLYCYTIDSTLA